MKPLLAGTALLVGAVVSPLCRGAEADDAKGAFTDFQAALKSGDPEKIWPLLDIKTQADADKAAATLKANYAKAKPADKAVLEKAFGLKADEIKDVTGKVYLKSKRFLGKYHEIPGSKFDKATIDGDKATINYTEEDGDKEKLSLVKQDGKWKVSIRVE
jgi:hypothetical protein